MTTLGEKILSTCSKCLPKSLRKRISASDSNQELMPNVTIGRHSYCVRKRTIFSELSPNQPPVSIGNFCSIASGVVILANADHPTHLPSIFPFRSTLFTKEARPGKDSPNPDVVSRGPVNIGHDVWIGTNAIVLSGVTIGTGAVIGAGAIVTKDIPPYAIAVGNPARVVRYRFAPEIIERLLRSEWWLLPDEAIRTLEPQFYSDDLPAFLDKVEAIKLKHV